jgi:HD-like signal output (HDOD) protein
MSSTTVSRQSLLQAVKTMSSAPQILARVGEELDKMDSSLEDIAGIIRLDAAITTRIIRVANSAAYNTSR